MRWAIAGLLFMAGAPAAKAGEAYYVLIFGQQQAPNVVHYSHTFAVFVKASWRESAPGTSPVSLDVCTISWMSARMRLRPLALAPECGRNCDLDTTLRWALANGMRTSLWGPYQIHPELYTAALQQANRLASGQVLYKLNDFGFRSDEVCNCIRAVGSVVTGPRRGVIAPGWGDTASSGVLCRMEPWIIDRGAVHGWVAGALGLNNYPIVYRDWTPPASTAAARRGPGF